mmetsp:Transcript_9884/g.24342  ORF Transcript_9884/g.24342 Transcript_9884/m.24342 type:complete len:97 (-) Transcript_9884:82-372(-)
MGNENGNTVHGASLVGGSRSHRMMRYVGYTVSLYINLVNVRHMEMILSIRKRLSKSRRILSSNCTIQEFYFQLELQRYHICKIEAHVCIILYSSFP